ncbi:MAG TPA: helix-turn-helix domain-containing protein [Trebonia sp.]|nr:helix-turn-helix domain-containing protein [Trebonia sp.]
MPVPDPQTLPPTFRVQTASRILGIGRNRTYELIKSGGYPVRVIESGGRYRVSRWDLLKYLGATPADTEPRKERETHRSGRLITMKMKYSVHVRCGCTGTDGKPLGNDCPQLWRKDKSGKPSIGKDGKPVWIGSRHGTAGWAARIQTSGGVKLIKRFGYATKTEADEAAQHAGKLLALATDDTTRRKIGDMIATTKRGASLPSVEDVARRIGAGLDPTTTGISVGEAWNAWLAGKKRLRASSHERLEVAGKHWILPAIGDVPLERLNGAHVAEVFTRMQRINAEIAARQGADRAYVRVESDVRTHPRLIGIASQHRVYAALREFCNFEMKKTRRLSFNPVYAVELEPEVTPEAKRWSAAQAREFLASTKGNPLGLLFRIVLLRGARRGEAVGLRWQDADLDAGYVRVRRPILLVRGAITESTPKTKTGDRLIWLDSETTRLLKEHRKAQLKTRLKAGQSWQDHDLSFCQDDGTPYKPDYVTRRFQRLATWEGCRSSSCTRADAPRPASRVTPRSTRRSGAGRSATRTRR